MVTLANFREAPAAPPLSAASGDPSLQTAMPHGAHLIRSLPLVVAGVTLASAPVTTGGVVAAPHRAVVVADSIYGLAVDSADYRDYSYVYLLDDGVVHVDADGRGTKTFRQVVQILKAGAVDQWAEQRYSYQPEHEKLTVNWMRVVRPDGSVVSDKPSLTQTSDVPATMQNPVYVDTKVVRSSLSGVAPGTLVDISYTIEDLKPWLPGNFFLSWSVSLPAPGMRSRLVLDVPQRLTPRIVERHLTFKRIEATQGGRHTYTWATRDLTPVKSEIFAPDSSVPDMTIGIVGALKWGDIGKWYESLSKDRYVLPPDLAARVDSVVRGAHTASDTLETLHHWIASDLRYVSVALGLGGYQPRFPEATVQTGYGDCKDKATLFIAAARHLGITAYPVLLNADGVEDSGLPAIEQFNHVIAAVPQKGKGAYEYVDLTTDDFPVGVVPPSYQGEFGLVVRPGGQTQEITFPEDTLNAVEQRFTGTLSADGQIAGRLTQSGRGLSEYSLRRAFDQPLDSARLANMKKSFPSPFPGATVDSIIGFDGRDWTAKPEYHVVLHGGTAARAAGPVTILSLPSSLQGAGARFRGLLNALEKADPRTLPIDASRIIGTRSITETRITLPDGWTAQLPKDVTLHSEFGSYTSSYAQQGNELRVAFTLSGAKGIFGPEKFPDLVAWVKAMVADDAEYIVLQKTQ